MLELRMIVWKQASGVRMDQRLGGNLFRHEHRLRLDRDGIGGNAAILVLHTKCGVLQAVATRQPEVKLDCGISAGT